MQKNEMKNFICSFLLSLLAVGAVGQAVFHMSENKKTPQKSEKITTYNISLFREKISNEPEDTSGHTLTQSTDEKIDLSAIDALVVMETEPQKENYEQIAHAELPLLDIEKNVSDIEKNVSAAPKILPLNTQINMDLNTAQEIALNDLRLPEEKNIDVSSAIAALTDMAQPELTETELTVFSHEPVYQPEENHEDHQTVIIAEANTTAFNNAEDVLIPLEKNTEIHHKSVDVLNSAKTSQVAMLEPNTLVASIDNSDIMPEKTLDEADLKQSEWKQMSSTAEDTPWVVAEVHADKETEKVEDNPWVVARGNKFAKNRAIVEQFAEKEPIYEPEASEESSTVSGELHVVADNPVESDTEAPVNQESKADNMLSELSGLDTQPTIETKPLLRPIEGETKLAYQMIDNLLIPIPEDIKNNTNLTPDLSVSPNEKPKEKINVQPPAQPAQNKKEKQKELNDADKESSLFKSIANWFSAKPENKEAKTVQNDKSKKKRKIGMTFFQSTEDADEIAEQPSIMPAELRLSFQPNRAEISGQTLRWIHAFADNARDNDGVFVEIRIDGTSSFALQQKRLNLLSTILANRGVDFRKINIVFTSREPNSFIIRNIRFSTNEEVVVEDGESTSYYRPW